MKFRYDSDADALMIHVLDDVVVARTEQIDDGTLVDLDTHGNVVAIELIHPARTWPLEDIVARYALDAPTAAMLEELWGHGETFPFASADGELVC